MTTQIDYKKVFSKLSHIKALSSDHKFDEIVQNLITHTLNNGECRNLTTEKEVAQKIIDIYGISIRNPVILSNLDKLLNKGDITKDPVTKRFCVTQIISNKLKQRIDEANQLEDHVKEKWFNELKVQNIDISEETLYIYWNCLKSYLCSVFEQHGIQSLQFLDPNTKINVDDQKTLTVIIENILKESNNIFSKETLSKSINGFIVNADEQRTNYISQLADATFTSYALTSDAETVYFLNQRYNSLFLFLDTNFIFGILDLHKNCEDASAREILYEVKKNRLPFKLVFHPETLSEFKRAFDARAMYIKASKWSRESSRVAITVNELSPIEELYHKQNVDNEIDPIVFLEKYSQVDLILKDLGLIEYTPNNTVNDEELVAIENDITKYQEFYESTPNRKNKSYSGFKHDVVVLREVRRLNPKKTKFLESSAFFISSDYILSKFEKKYFKKNWEINYVASPSVFLQLIRPFIENDHTANKRFIDTFSIPEFRTFDIDYTSTRSKALQILNDNYHDTSFETKVKILRDLVLLDKLDKATEDYERQCNLIENQIAIENQILTKQKEEAIENIKQIETEKNIIEQEKSQIEIEKKQVELEKSNAISIIQNQNSEIKEKQDEIDKLRLAHAIDALKNEIKHKSEVYKILSNTIEESDKTNISLLFIVYEKIKKHKFYLSLIPIAFLVIICGLIYKLTWNVMEPITYIMSILAVIVGYLYFAIKGESINPSKYFDYYENKTKLMVYNKFNFDINKLVSQKEEFKNLKIEIDKLEKELDELTASA